MSRTRHKSGVVQYLGRALRMDAAEAMGRDIIRAIIELLTNADDAYTRQKTSSGKIWIGIEHGYKRDSRRLVVRDRAAGMRMADMEAKLTHIGARASGFEQGEAVRGNRGRGAKDLIAFGFVVFEAIKDGYYARLELRPDGHWDADERKATQEDRRSLHVPRGNGMQVTVSVERKFPVPRHDRLAEAIQRDFQLRDIMADPGREVLLAKLDRDAQTVRLRYEVDEATVTQLLDTTLSIPGYPAADARLRVVQLPERCDAGPADRSRPGGVLIAGRKAIYDNTLGKFENVPHAGWIAGRLDCAFIDHLAREFDDRDEAGERQSEDNPIQIISRRRQGLAPDHPFTEALFKATEEQLAPIVARLEEESRARSQELETSQTRQQLDRLSREMAKLMAEVMREIEEEDQRGPKPGQLLPIRLIPDHLYVEVGATKTLSVVCDRFGLAEDDEVALEVEPGAGVLYLPDGITAPLRPHRDRADALSARVPVTALVEDAEAIVSATIGDRSEAALVRCIAKQDEPEPEPPEELEFERDKVKIGFGKVKPVELRAPAEAVENYGTRVHIRSTHQGIVLRRHQVDLVLDEDLGWYTARVRVEGRALAARGKLVAQLGTATAESRLQVVERDDGLPDLDIRFSHEEPGPFRAYFDPPEPGPDGSQILHILVRHPAVLPLLGADLAGQQSEEWHVALGEIVTEAMVRRIMTRRFPVTQEADAQTIYREHAKWHTRLLPRIQRLIVVASTRGRAIGAV
jgi:hypothetical protein